MKYAVSKVDYFIGDPVYTWDEFTGDTEWECLLKAQAQFGSIATWHRVEHRKDHTQPREPDAPSEPAPAPAPPPAPDSKKASTTK